MSKTIYAEPVNLNDICYRESHNGITGARTEKPFAVIIYGDFSEEQAKKLSKTLHRVLNRITVSD